MRLCPQNLFYLSKEPVSVNDYLPTGDSLWGRSPYLNALRLGDDRISVAVSEDYPGEEKLVPRAVVMSMFYYQVSPTSKRLVEASIEYHELCSISESTTELDVLSRRDPPIFKCEDTYRDYNYTLEFLWEPLSYMELLNKFEFTFDVYLAFFVIIGLSIVAIGFIVWAFNRLITRLRHPPKFRFRSLFKMVSPAAMLGVTLSSLPFVLAVLFLWLWHFGLVSEYPVDQPNTVSFEQSRNEWGNPAVMTEDDIFENHRGRFGFCLQLVGFFTVLVGFRLLIPGRADPHIEDDITREDQNKNVNLDTLDLTAEEEKVELETAVWYPWKWKRALSILFVFAIILFLVRGVASPYGFAS